MDPMFGINLPNPFEMGWMWDQVIINSLKQKPNVSNVCHAYIYPTQSKRAGCETRLISKMSSLVGKVFANGPAIWGSIPGWVIPKTKKNDIWCCLALHLALEGMDHGWSGAIPRNE